MEGGFLRAGRFLPYELPGMGYLDGLQLEKVVSPAIRVGDVLGTKPTRDRLNLSGKEPLNSFYVTAEAGTRRSLYYSGTTGLLTGFYRGRMDRAAFLNQQQMDLGERLSFFSNAEIDFDVDNVTGTTRGPQLSRLSLLGNARVSRALGLRAGIERFQWTDTLAEREFMGIQDPGAMDGSKYY